ncbi:histidine kinase [Leptobacterium flavescens]|uniref:Histidine kinase n=1 Tax=Leptobacterium flavescens TaxID=472055 RepID=A0A6P0UPU5_9FLAO|nr:histidine kinase [Leptobacterium flavescens]NER15364.1 histidine kinase [Leptobacterium flavescens]
MKQFHKEILFQGLLSLVLFTFLTFDKRRPSVHWSDIAFFSNYLIVSLFIGYHLLPAYLYKKKYYHFFLGLLIAIAVAFIVEEFVVEQIFFPNTRGQYVSVLYTLIDILPVIAVFVGFKFGWDALKKQRELDNLKQMVQESELQFLKSQINPHFLFNNLNNLYSYAIESSPKTPSIILELSSVLRYMLYDCREPFVPLQKEIEHLKHFTALNELQIEQRGDIQFNVKNGSQAFRIAPLILIVFVENAFKHSTASQSENINIRICIKVNDDGVLKFLCENSFLPNTNTDNLSHGIGLENVKKRLNLLYKDAYSLDISQKDDIYRVYLELNLNESVND